MSFATDNATSIKGIFQGLVPDGAAVIQGVVKSVSPLTIQAVNDEKLNLNASTLIVPKHLTNYTAKVDIIQDEGTVESNTTTSGALITVYNSLKVGEAVHLLSFNNGKKYYVLDRVM